MTMRAATPKATTATGATMRSGLRCTGSIAGRMVAAWGYPSGHLDQFPSRGSELLRGGRRSLCRVAAALAMRVDDRARGGDEARGGMGREGRCERVDGPALGAHARQQEDRVRHQLAQAGEQVGARGSGDRTDVREAAAAPALAPGLVDHPRRALVEGLVRWLVLDLRRPRIGGADETEATRARGVGGLDERLERVAAEQRVGGEGVGAEAGDGAERPGRLAHERLRVRARRDRNVAALAVGDREQPALASGFDDALERTPAAGPEALEAGELKLDRHTRTTGGVHGRDAVALDGGGCERGGVADDRLAVGGRVGLDRARP